MWVEFILYLFMIGLSPPPPQKPQGVPIWHHTVKHTHTLRWKNILKWILIINGFEKYIYASENVIYHLEKVGKRYKSSRV